MPNNLKNVKKNVDYNVARVWENGVYHFMLKVEPATKQFPFNATVIVKMKSTSGYLPAIEWPLLPLMVSMDYFIFIFTVGALANTLAFVELSDQNATGNGIEPLKWLSVFLTVLQNGLMQLLVMIVSTGYGITRPHLHKALFASAVCLAAVTSLAQFMSIVVLDEDIQVVWQVIILNIKDSITSLLLLLVLMWLWRPVDQAQTYAFTPLSTEEVIHQSGDYDEEDEDDTLFEKTELRIMNT
ncbi:hypothetical protein LSH36_3g01014 [Paralvinella palmiformis]|uniref:GOST seven transmembrane domain-containing protein n=1 Tax=Paralvinella palmiformis TaxID=53620 RepID=A0AAD9NKA2_9ANNE|nr:hypothetical protein LSH36_3g01014 [Paralvinella palmiformis]